MKRIQPSKQSSKTHTWRRWKAVAPAVKREVLTNLSRILHVWLRHLQRQKLEVIRPSSDWAPPRLQSGCERLTPTPQAWTRDPWQQLAFQPTHPLRLHYRLTFQAPDWSRYSKRYLRRFSTSMRRRIRSFQLEAIGCGLRFLLDGSQNERILHFSRIQVLPIPTQ